MSTGPVTLVILDGWGLSSSPDNNAACIAKTPVYDRLRAEYPKSLLSTSGEDVGLPAGQMGNSEVGHLNIGAGRIVYQDLSRIGRAIEDGSFFDNAALKQACEKVVASGGKLHLLGLLSDGGVHSHNTHIYALIRMAAQMGVKDVCVHAFMDGRDTSPKNGVGYLAELEQQMQELGCGRVASISGRYFAMDRDNRWERVEKAYRAVTEAKGEQFDSSAAAIEAAYADDQTDEFVIPRVVGGGAPFAANDGVIFFNFRADRAREMTRALTLDDFDGFDRGAKPQLVEYVCLTEYDETFDLPVAYPAESYPEILAEVVSRAGKKQLRIAETEKYAHVTFFFNGGVEKPWPGEERLLVQSPQDVATYDLKPEMSAYQIADTVTKRIKEEHYDFIVINFANCDMVGHTGVLDAAVAAVEAVDTCLGKVVETVLEAGGKLLITADHGNCEQMVDAQGRPHTAHTTNPVEFVYVDDSNKDAQVTDGILADLAPTAVELLGLQQPEVMTGTSLIKH